MYRSIMFNIVQSIVLSTVLTEIYVFNQAVAHPLKNIVKTKYHSRNKRDIDILAECDTECLPEEEIGDDYDILLYYEYEEITEFPLEYTYPDYEKGMEKSCMYRCKILDLNETNEVTTEPVIKINLNNTTMETTHSMVELTTDPGVQPLADNTTVANDSLNIGFRFMVGSEKPDQVQPTTSAALPSKPPIVLIPKKLKLTVFEAELMEAELKPDHPTKQTGVVNNKNENTSGASVIGKNDTVVINHKTKSKQDLQDSNKSTDNIEVLSNFLRLNNKVEDTTLNDVVLKIKNTGQNPDSGQLLINDSEVKCKVFLINENFPGETTTGKSTALNFSNVANKEIVSYDNIVSTTTATTKYPFSPEATTNDAVGIVPTTGDTTGKDKQPHENPSKTETSSQENKDLKPVEPISENANPTTMQVTAEEVSITENTTLPETKPDNQTDFTKKEDPISIRSGHLLPDQDISGKNHSNVKETEAEGKQNSSNDTTYDVDNVEQTNDYNSKLNTTESVTKLLSEITTENISPSKVTINTNKAVLNLDIDNFSFHGNFTTSDKSNITEQLERAIAENLRKVDNTSSVIVSPQFKNKPKAVTKLDMVRTGN